MSVTRHCPVADRLFTADEVGVIVEWFGGHAGRWRQHVEADSDVVNVGHAPDEGAVEALCRLIEAAEGVTETRNYDAAVRWRKALDAAINALPTGGQP